MENKKPALNDKDLPLVHFLILLLLVGVLRFADHYINGCASPDTGFGFFQYVLSILNYIVFGLLVIVSFVFLTSRNVSKGNFHPLPKIAEKYTQSFSKDEVTRLHTTWAYYFEELLGNVGKTNDVINLMEQWRIYYALKFRRIYLLLGLYLIGWVVLFFHFLVFRHNESLMELLNKLPFDLIAVQSGTMIAATIVIVYHFRYLIQLFVVGSKKEIAQEYLKKQLNS